MTLFYLSLPIAHQVIAIGRTDAMEFTLNEVSILFEYALQHNQIEAAGLALKAALVAKTPSYTFLSKAVENCILHQRAKNGLLLFTQYDQLNLIIELLQSDSIKLKTIAILTLQELREPRALEPLNQLMQESDSEIIRERAANAYKTITEKPVALLDIPTYRQLTPLDEMDMAFADIILNRDFANKEVSVLVKLLFHPIYEIKKQAEKALLQRGEQITDSVFDAVSSLNPPITLELINVVTNYKDPRGAHLIIQNLKSKNYSDVNTFDKAIESLGRIGGEEVALYLAERIVEGRYYHKLIDAIKKIDTIPVSYLISEYKSNDHFRRTGAKILATILGVKALQALLEGIQDRYLQVRINAESGITELGNLAIESLIALLNSSNDEDVKLGICRTMGKIGDRRTLTSLEKLAKSNNKNLHLAAIEAIGKIADSLSVLILSKWIESSDYNSRRLVAKGLGQQYYITALDPLIKGVYDIDQKVRLEVIASLYNLASRLESVQNSVTDVFLLLLTDGDKEVASLAKKYLIELGSRFKNIEEKINRAQKTVGNEEIINNLNDVIRNKIAESKRHHPIPGMASLSGLERFDYKPPPPTIEIPRPITDSIQLAVSAPRVVCPGRSFILDVWAYLSSYSTEIYDFVGWAQGDKAIAMQSKGPIQLQRDTTLIIRINIPDFGVKGKDTIYWVGLTGNCTFPVKVPKEIDLGFYLGIANFYVGPLLIAKLNFDIEVGQQQKAEANITTRKQIIKTAFASYASDDRDKVLGRIQGMLKLVPELDIFLDVASLRSGEDWEHRLENEIKIRDLFYLFWSSAASKSPWVEKEWRTALLSKGINCIDPVPLEPPNKVPPPPELSSLHFNEWTLAYQK